MAGAGIKEIKNRINSIESTKQITKAMELVASSKMRKAKDRALANKPYFDIMYDTVKDIATNTKGVRDLFLKQREVKNKCYIVVAGDRGLAGGYNSNIFKLTTAHMDGKQEKIMAVGKKSVEFFQKRGYDVLITEDSIERCDYEKTLEIANTAMDLYKKGEIDEVYISYTEFVSPLVQCPKLIKVLPLVFEEDEAEVKSTKDVGRKARVQYLPSPEAVLSYIIPKYVSSIVYGGIVEAFASEQSARRNAMKSASDSADEMLSTLELSYNRARQSAVTGEIIDIVGGVEALK